MTVYVSPGVYAREIDLSQYAPALATSILGIIGGAHKGPLNDAVLITNTADLINEFGTPTDDSFLVHCGLQFLRQGRQLRVVRIADGTEAVATVTIAGLAQPANFISSVDLSRGVDLTTLKNIKLTTDTTTKEVDLTTGWTGDITKVSITHIVDRLNHVTDGIPGVASKDNTNARVILHSTSAGSTKFVRVEATLTPTNNAAPVVLGVSQYPTQYDGQDAVASALKVSANSTGDWANGYGIQIAMGTVSGTFRITVYDANGNTLEDLDNITMSTCEQEINNKSRFIVVDDFDQTVPPSPTLVYSATTITSRRYYINGGLAGVSGLTDGDYIGTYTAGVPSGMKVLANPEKIDLNIIACPGISSAAVIVEMIDLCRSRADCICLVDPPLGLDVEQVADWHNGQGTWSGLHSAFNSSYGALYWPWEEYYDSYNQKRIFIPPSCWVSAQMAYTDYVAEVWSAPAGLNRGRITVGLSTEFNPDQGQRDFLYSGGNAVNPIVDFPIDGITIWGQRTLQRTASALDRVNVRRLLLYIEKVISTASRAVLFEPNIEATWKRLKNLISPVLDSIKARGGLEDFQVKIDSSTTTDYEKNRNTIVGKIFLIPTKTAEIIQLDFVILPSGASFSEV